MGRGKAIVNKMNRNEIEEKIHHKLCDENGMINRKQIEFRDMFLDCLEATGLIEITGNKWIAPL